MDTDLLTELKEWLEGRKEDLLADLAGLAAIPR